MKPLQFVIGACLAIAVFLFGLPSLLFLLSGALIVVPWRPKRHASLPLRWKVEVASATLQKTDYAESWSKGRTRVEGETAVRLYRGGGETHPIGTAKVAAPDFEQKLQKLVTLAEERASFLNAYSDGLT